MLHGLGTAGLGSIVGGLILNGEMEKRLPYDSELNLPPRHTLLLLNFHTKPPLLFYFSKIIFKVFSSLFPGLVQSKASLSVPVPIPHHPQKNMVCFILPNAP